jgi:hypothetical protein
MDLVPITEELIRMDLAAVDNAEDGAVGMPDGEMIQDVGEGCPRRGRHVKLTLGARRGLTLQRGVQADGDYQLKTLSRSDSAVS